MSNRSELEAQIIERAKYAVPDRETGCLDEEKLYEYLEAWYQLVKYYRENEDFSISVEVLENISVA